MTFRGTKPRFLVLGQATLDRTRDGDRLGGKAFNQAVALRRLNTYVEFASAIGNDNVGDDIREQLAREGIGKKYLTDSNEFSRVPVPSVVVWMDHASGDRIIKTENEGALERGFDHIIVRLEEQDLSAYDAISLTFEVPEPALTALLERLSNTPNRGLVVVNPAPPRPRLSSLTFKLLSCAHVLTPNMHEAAQLLGRPIADGRAAAAEISGRFGVPYVCITAGANGSYWASARHIGFQRAFPSAVCDPIGASDIYTAVITAALAAGAEFDDAVQLGTVAAGVAVGHVGGFESAPTARELAKYLAVSDASWDGARRSLERLNSDAG